ncbi:hypothetical protein [Sphingomonas baiyangensis]|uniref:Carboxypeptidase regulatory-like domain-containing protein n=1 Tax=Sphingomonas baiyangensis TaxID=2572576 RepID=A0A4U1L0H5_9SPHN|nr:hypothetical protein [Sphingomonas baiyangensis]TKD50249.1 hypothetical protein FBR43_05360 [Sphingomonas baiyangensis]
MSDARFWVAAILVLALVAAVVRILRRQRAAAQPAARWRPALLVALQAAAAGALWCMLFPPPIAVPRGVLVVATEDAPATLEAAPGETLVALPEAPAIADARRVPDLATALRQHPDAARLRIVGSGLAPRDRQPLPLPTRFDPPAPFSGLVALALPDSAAPGSAFAISGEVRGHRGAIVGLADPSGSIVDLARVGDDGRFTLRGTARTAGPARFELRVAARDGGMIERVAIPVVAREQRLPRVHVLAGAPGAETKFLRRWAADAGIAIALEAPLGAGVLLADDRLPITAATLGRIDLLVIDDRRWDALDGSARATIINAVDAGLGLLLRPGGALSAATQRSWASLGLDVARGEAVLPVRTADRDAPVVGRRDLIRPTPQAVTLLRDAGGEPLAAWRARGRGRIGIWAVPESYALTLAGDGERYGAWWSSLFSTLARADGEQSPAIDGIGRSGERVAICGLSGAATIDAPEGRATPLVVDPASGVHACAAYWPRAEGWHRLRNGEGRETALYVHPAGALVAVARSDRHAATIALAAASRQVRADAPARTAPGSPWPWFAALLVTLGLLWWLERSRFGRAERG